MVKRLVSIEDLGNIEVLFTDKTGTLTEGHDHVLRGARRRSAAAAGGPRRRVARATTRRSLTGGWSGGNQLDQALWGAPSAHAPAPSGPGGSPSVPFDHERRSASVLVEALTADSDGRRQGRARGGARALRDVDPRAQAVLDREFAAGARVVAVATRAGRRPDALSADDERDLELVGFLAFVDRPKADAARGARPARGASASQVKVITGDNGTRRGEGLRRPRPRR